MQQPTLATERLILRPFEPADAAAVQLLAGERAVADTTLSIPHPYPDGAAEEWIATHASAFDGGAAATFAIIARADEQLTGTIGLNIDANHAVAELGYWIAVPAWGRGYATEAARAVLSFGFTSLGLNRIQARHFVRNPASGRVMQKLGMTYEGTLRQAMRKYDRIEDVAVYAILAAEWNLSTAREEGSTTWYRPA